MHGMTQQEQTKHSIAAAQQAFNEARNEVNQLLRGQLPASAVNGSIQQAAEFKKLLARGEKLPTQASGEFTQIALQTRKLRKFISEWHGFDSATPKAKKGRAA